MKSAIESFRDVQLCFEANQAGFQTGTIQKNGAVFEVNMPIFEDPAETETIGPRSIFLRNGTYIYFPRCHSFLSQHAYMDHPRPGLMKYSAPEAVLGLRSWAENTGVQSVQILTRGDNGILFAPDIQQKIKNSNQATYEDGTIVSFICDRYALEIRYGVSQMGDKRFGASENPDIFLRYSTPVSIESVRDDCQSIQSFLCLASGSYVSFSAIFLFSGFSFEDDVKQEICFEYITNGFSDEKSEVDVSSFEHFLFCRFPKQRAEFQRCLKAWLSGESGMSNDAQNGVTRSATARNEVSGSKLIDAISWLDGLAKTKESKTPDAFFEIMKKELCATAVETATQGGRELPPDFAARLANAIRQMSEPNRKSKIQKLIGEASEGIRLFSENADGSKSEKLCQDLLNAYRSRGKQAHNLVDFKSQSEFDEFVIQLRAVETLCYGLIYAKLGVEKGPIAELSNLPIGEYFKHLNPSVT